MKALQEILEPCFPLQGVGQRLNNEGEIDSLYLDADKSAGGLLLVKRRFPDGSVKWFEEVACS